MSIVGWTINQFAGPPTSQTNTIIFPRTIHQNMILECIGVSIYRNCTINNVSINCHIVIITININPTGLLYTIEVTIGITTVIACMNTINCNINIMTVCRDSFTPTNNRITNSTVCSACISCFGTSCSLIIKRSHNMLVEANTSSLTIIDPCLCTLYALSGIVCEEKLGINKNILHAKGACCVIDIGYNATFERNFNALRPDNASINKSSRRLILISLILCNMRFPSTNWNGCDYCFARCSIVACTGNRNSCNIIIFLNRPFCSKSCCNRHTLEFPRTCVIKVKCHFDFLNLFDIRSYNIHPIKRTDKKSIRLGILRNYGYSGSICSSINSNRTADPRTISCVIGNFKLNSVHAVSKSNIIYGNLAVCKSASNFIAVNICLSRRSVETHCIISRKIRNLYLESGVIEVNGLTAYYSIDRTNGIKNHRIGKYRILSILYCGRVVNRNIINIEREFSIEVRCGYIIVIRVSGRIRCRSTIVDTNADSIEPVCC